VQHLATFSHLVVQEPVELEAAEAQDQVVARIRARVNQQTPSSEVVDSSLDAMLGAIEEDIDERGAAPQREREALTRLRTLDLPTLSKAEFVARTYFDAQFLLFSTHV
jgi:hypothetical protein